MKTTILLLLACSLGVAAGPPFFPLETGNEWVYRNPETGSTFTVRVGVPVISGDNAYYTLSGYVNSRLFVRAGEDGSLYYRDEENQRDLLLTSFEPFEDGWFHAPFRPCEQEGQTAVRREEYRGAAGAFNALRIRYRSYDCADTGVTEELYAENVGMLSRTTSTIAGPRQFHLVAARIGKMELTRQAGGTFSVTVNPPGPSDESAVAMLRLAVSRPVVLRYASAQEYDVLLRDSEGRVLWRWSDGKVFPAVVSDITVEGERVWRVKVPLRVLELPLPSGRYSVEAWLPTGDERPQFAATAALEIVGGQTD